MAAFPGFYPFAQAAAGGREERCGGRATELSDPLNGHFPANRRFKLCLPNTKSIVARAAAVSRIGRCVMANGTIRS